MTSDSGDRARRGVLLYRRTLDARSGAGQLIGMQADGLRRAGVPVRIVCRRGRFRYLIRTGRWADKMTPAMIDRLSLRRETIVVDHGLELTDPDIVFVHSLASAASEYLDRADLRAAADDEAEYFGRLAGDVRVVANSELVRSAVVARFGLAPGRVSVIYPGHGSDRFDPANTIALRQKARRSLGLPADAPVVGVVTSGDLELRGLDLFLDAAAGIAAERPDARFLVVGAKQLPAWARSHAIAAAGKLVYRPKSGNPELWMSALDIFVHSGRFEAFGMALAEALAVGIPILTSRRVGLAEILPPSYGPWIADRPHGGAFARLTLALLAAPDERLRLIDAGIGLARTLTAERYAEESVRAICAGSTLAK